MLEVDAGKQEVFADVQSSPLHEPHGRIADDEGTLRWDARDLTRWVLPEPEGPIRRMLDFSIRTLCKTASAMIGSGSSRSQVSKWFETPRANRLFATLCPIMN